MEEAGVQPERPPPGTPRPPSGPALLPAHRIALHALIGASVAGGLCTAWALTACSSQYYYPLALNPHNRPLVPVLACLVGSASLLGLLLVAEQLGRRVHPGLRPVVLGLGALLGGLSSLLALAWALAALEREHPLPALAAVLERAGAAVPGGGPAVAFRAEQFQLVVVGPLLPFLALGWVRERAARVRTLEVLVAVASGFAALVVHEIRAPYPGHPVLLPALFLGLPVVAVLGLWLGERIEARLLAWIRTLQED